MYAYVKHQMGPLITTEKCPTEQSNIENLIITNRIEKHCYIHLQVPHQTN